MDEAITKMMMKLHIEMQKVIPDVVLPDPDGNTICLHKHEGCYYPAIPGIHERIQTAKEFKLRPDDVLLCSYPKSGAHWHYELCKMIVHQTSKPLPGAKVQMTIEIMPDEILDLAPSPRFLNTHFLPKYLPRDALEGRTKLIYIVRNPKDVAVSYYNHTVTVEHAKYAGNWAGFLELYLQGTVDYGSWFDYTLAWEQFIKAHPELPILRIHYEDTKEHPTKQVSRIADFLGKPCDESLLEGIAEAGGFAKLRESKTENQSGMEKLSFKMYRKGEVGDWKNWFTIAQNERFDTIYKEKMKDLGVNIRFEL